MRVSENAPLRKNSRNQGERVFVYSPHLIDSPQEIDSTIEDFVSGLVQYLYNAKGRGAARGSEAEPLTMREQLEYGWGNIRVPQLVRQVQLNDPSFTYESVSPHGYGRNDILTLEARLEGVRQALVDRTLGRIAQGIRDTHRNDGSIFKNRDGRLPDQSEGYYREHVIRTPGVSRAGLQRMVTGAQGEVYYSPNHYETLLRMR